MFGPANDLVCFVISLERAEQRRQSISENLSALEIPFQFIDAVDAQQGDILSRPDVDPKGARKRMQRDLLPGEFACALSHAKALREFLAGPCDYALILEDDAIIDENLRRYIDGGHYRKAPMTQLCHLAARVRDLRGEKLFGEFLLLRPINTPYMAAAYVVNRKAAGKIVKALTPVRSIADWPVDLPKIGARLTQPMVVTHPPHNDAAQSQIGQRAYQTLREKHGAKRYFLREYWLRKWLRATTTRIS